MNIEERFAFWIGGNIFLIDVGSNSYHKFSKDAIKVHENIVRVVCLEECSRNITGCNITMFMGKDGALNEDGFRGNCRSGGFFFGSMFPLFATISTASGFDFTCALFSDEHEGSKSIVDISMAENAWIGGLETVEYVNLTKFFH